MNKIILLSLMLFTILCSSCEYDNYDAPALTLYGQLTYNGNHFLSDGNPDKGLLKVIQKGFGKQDGGTALRVDETGKFQQLLFSGEYWLTLDNNQYPFELKDIKSLGSGLGYDSIYIQLSSDLKRDFEVTPYYTVDNFTTSVEDGNIVMRFKVAKTSGTINPAPKVVRARAYINTATLVNSKTTFTTSKDIIITDQGDVELSMSISNGDNSYRKAYTNNLRTYAFCRVAIELDNIPNYYLFSETKKVEGLPQ
jgi:hypothetical protein